MIRVLLLVLVAIGSCGCSGPAWTGADTKAATDAVKLAKACDGLCLGDAGCAPQVAAGCFEAIGCNVGSMLPRHGAPGLIAADAGCKADP